jgi:hypothetical protein
MDYQHYPQVLMGCRHYLQVQTVFLCPQAPTVFQCCPQAPTAFQYCPQAPMDCQFCLQVLMGRLYSHQA